MARGPKQVLGADRRFTGKLGGVASGLDSAFRSATKGDPDPSPENSMNLFGGSGKIFRLIANSEKCYLSIGWRRGRVAEGGGLLKRKPPFLAVSHSIKSSIFTGVSRTSWLWPSLIKSGDFTPFGGNSGGKLKAADSSRPPPFMLASRKIA